MDNPEILAALIAAAVSLVTAIGGALYARRNALELERIKTRLEEEAKEKDALRDYRYEARKRLYQECEPVLFSLAELSENALGRIKGLARAARDGELRDSQTGWLASDEGYYFTSTLYRLLAPTAVYKILRQLLTSVDLTVDSRIKAQYQVAKLLYRSFRDDYGLARVPPSLEYDSNSSHAHDRFRQEPRVYWRQGIIWGRLDDALDALTPAADEGGAQLMSYGRFESLYLGNPEFRNRFREAAVPLLQFHPRTRPVFWRMLIAQAFLYEAFLRVHRLSADARVPAVPLDLLPEVAPDAFDWREPGSDIADVEVRQPIAAARRYLEHRLEGSTGR